MSNLAFLVGAGYNVLAVLHKIEKSISILFSFSILCPPPLPKTPKGIKTDCAQADKRNAVMKRERSLNTARLLSLITLVSMGFAVVISSRFRVTCSLALSVKKTPNRTTFPHK